MTRFRVRSAFAAALLLAAPGCYRYVPMAFDQLPPGGDVRVSLSRETLAGLEEAAVPLDGASVRGRIARQDGDRIFLRVPVASRQVGFHTERIDQEIQIPLGGISLVERRELDRLATSAAIGGAIAAAATVLFVIMDTYTDEDLGPEPCGEGCVEMGGFPVFTWPLR